MENLKPFLLEVSEKINKYVDVKDSKSLKEIEETIKKEFQIDDLIFFKFIDSKDKTKAIKFNLGNSLEIKIEESFLKYAIRSKIIQFDNHITSNKYYNPKIDNPKDLLVRRILIAPIKKGDNLLGMVCLHRTIYQKLNFTRKDELFLKECSFVFSHFLEPEKIEKLDFLNKDFLDKKNTKIVPKKEIKNRDNSLELKNLQIKYKQLEEKYSIREEDFLNTQKEIIPYQERLVKKEEDIKILNIELKELKEKVKEKNDIIQKYETKYTNLKKIVSSNNQNSFDEIDENIETLLEKIEHHFKDSYNIYSLFEVIFYSLSSTKGILNFENFLEENLFLEKVVDNVCQAHNIKIYRKSHNIQDFFKKLISLNRNLEIILDKSLPQTLVFDAPKVHNFIFHLIKEMGTENIIVLNVEYKEKDKKLILTLETNIKNKDKINKKTILQKKSKESLDMRLSVKLIKVLGGEIKTSQKDEKLTYKISIPAQIVNFGF